MIRLVYQRGDFDAGADRPSSRTALFWFAFSLPTNGLYLLQTRTFFSLQRPWHGDRRWRRSTWSSRPLAALRPLQAVRGRRDRRRHRDRHHAPRSSPRRWSCAASSAASSWAACSRPRSGSRSPRRPWPRSAAGLGPPRRRARARPARPDRLARRRAGARRRSPTSASAKLLRIAELEQIMRLLRARARCSAPAATCWASPSSPLLVGFAWLGAAARAAAACCPSSRGARRSWRPRSSPGAPDLGGGAARHASGCSSRCRTWSLVAVVGRGLGVCGGVLAAGGVPQSCLRVACADPLASGDGPAVGAFVADRRRPADRRGRGRPLRRRREAAARRPG